MSNKVGRPEQEPTKVMRIPASKIEKVERFLNRPLADNQEPHINVRVKETDVLAIQELIK